MTTETMIHLSLRDLRLLVKPVCSFASQDGMLPVLCGVQISTHGDEIRAAATDRFRLGATRVTPQVVIATDTGYVRTAAEPDDGEQKTAVPVGVHWLVPRRFLLRVLNTIQPEKRGDDAKIVVTLTRAGNEQGEQFLTVAARDWRLKDAGEVSMTTKLLDGEFPKVNGLLAKSIGDKEDRAAVVGLNAPFLQSFIDAHRAVGDRHQALVLKVRGAKEPIVGFVGETFVGIQMPKRMVGLTNDPAEMSPDSMAAADVETLSAAWMASLSS